MINPVLCWRSHFDLSCSTLECIKNRHQKKRDIRPAEANLHRTTNGFQLRVCWFLTCSPSLTKSFLQMWAMMPVASASPITLTMVLNRSLRNDINSYPQTVSLIWERCSRWGLCWLSFMVTLSGFVLGDPSLTVPSQQQWWEWCRRWAAPQMSARSPW